MRFPAYFDLDKEQKKIFNSAPINKNILVVGPPGTGKTVMALHRAIKIKDQDKDACVIMYNNVLAQYTSSGGSTEKLSVRTMHNWVDDWWRQLFPVYAPRYPGERYQIDWGEIFKKVVSINDLQRLKKLNWGNLIIDEGQDFAKEMYENLHLISEHFRSYDLDANITVFADENQRLVMKQNSTIEEISEALCINITNQERKYYLSQNFRNTKQVAEFAQHFQTNDIGVVASLPTREGDKPQIVLSITDEEIFRHILNGIRNAPGQQFGIIVDGKNTVVMQYYNKLKNELDNNNNYSVQCYIGNDKNHKDLNFDDINTVTILNKMSAKGTEFDVVYYVGLEGRDYYADDGFAQKMSVYTMSSRPRNKLTICLSGISDTDDLPSVLKIFPKNVSNLCRYIGLGDLPAVITID